MVRFRWRLWWLFSSPIIHWNYSQNWYTQVHLLSCPFRLGDLKSMPISVAGHLKIKSISNNHTKRVSHVIYKKNVSWHLEWEAGCGVLRPLWGVTEISRVWVHSLLVPSKSLWPGDKKELQSKVLREIASIYLAMHSLHSLFIHSTTIYRAECSLWTATSWGSEPQWWMKQRSCLHGASRLEWG